MTLVTFDGPLAGGGATLQVGLRSREEAISKPIVSYWADVWSEKDRYRLNIELNDLAGQARVEAYTLLASVATWRETLLRSQGSLAIVGDALGVLHDAAKLRAKDAVFIAILGGVALLLAPSGMDIRVAHIWTQRNTTCDA